ncbi:MAG: enoyl-CoA hydratase/isomerase family protein [Pseudomonadota bacterium]
MADRISEIQSGGAMVLAWTGPVTPELCDQLRAAVEAGQVDPEVTFLKLVLGPDSLGIAHGLRELQPVSECLSTLARRMAACAKPVVAILQGDLSDATLELALAAHIRVAHPSVRVSMPAVEMGLIPMAGATQRLPRVIAPKASAHLLLTGETWPITDIRLKGLAEIVTDVDDASAIQALIETRTPMPEDVTVEPDKFQVALADARARFPRPAPAQADIIACLEAAQLLPLEQGLNFETARFVQRARDPQSRLLRHAAFVEESARHRPLSTSATPGRVQNVVVMGRSSETADLAAMGLEQGYRVWIEAGSTHMGRALAELACKRLRPPFRSSEEVKARLGVDLTGAEMEEADLIFDTAELTPDPPVTLKTGGVWIVTSPDIAAADRAREVQSEGRALRMRRLLRASHVVELSAPPETEESALITAHAALSSGGQSVILTKDAPGGLLGALFGALSRAALVMLAAGKDPGEIEHAARAMGLRQGPLQMIDVLGAGRALSQMRRIYEQRDVSLAPLRLLSDRMSDVTGGDEARARRALVFHAPAGQSFARDPDLIPWLAEWREDHPDRCVTWPGVDLEAAMRAALVAEAARLIQAEVVERPSDIDLAAQKGLLMDPLRGGPLIQSDLMGVLGISSTLAQLQATDPAVWAREPLIVDMVKNGRSFF